VRTVLEPRAGDEGSVGSGDSGEQGCEVEAGQATVRRWQRWMLALVKRGKA